MSPRRLALAGAALLVAVVGGLSAAGATPAGCSAAHLTARMAVIHGSAGAGGISYAVSLVNQGSHACPVSGRPGLQLLDHDQHALPTHVVADHPGTGTAALITIGHEHRAIAVARFSPDIPGEGEGNPCEKKAWFVRVTVPSPGHGTLVGHVLPATPVCEHGRIVLGLLHAGSG